MIALLHVQHTWSKLLKKNTFQCHCNIKTVFFILLQLIFLWFYYPKTSLILTPKAEAIASAETSWGGGGGEQMQKSRSEWEKGVGVGMRALRVPLRANLLHGFASVKIDQKGTLHIMNHEIHQPRNRARHESMRPISFPITRRDVEATNYRAAQQPAFNNGLFLCVLILRLSDIVVSFLRLCTRGHTLHQVAILEGGEAWIGF